MLAVTMGQLLKYDKDLEVPDSGLFGVIFHLIRCTNLYMFPVTLCTFVQEAAASMSQFA